MGISLLSPSSLQVSIWYLAASEFDIGLWPSCHAKFTPRRHCIRNQLWFYRNMKEFMHKIAGLVQRPFLIQTNLFQNAETLARNTSPHPLGTCALKFAPGRCDRALSFASPLLCLVM